MHIILKHRLDMNNNAVDITFASDRGLINGKAFNKMGKIMDECYNQNEFNEQVEVTHKEVKPPVLSALSGSKPAKKSNISSTQSTFMKRSPSLDFILRAVTPKRTRERKLSKAKAKSPSPSKILSKESPRTKSFVKEMATPKKSNRLNMRFRSLSPSNKLPPFISSTWKNDENEDGLDMNQRVERNNNTNQERMVLPRSIRTSSPIERRVPQVTRIYSTLPSDRSTSTNATDSSTSLTSLSQKARILRTESDSALFSRAESKKETDNNSPLPLAKSPSKGSRSISEILCNTALSFGYDSDNTDTSSRNGVNLIFPHTNSFLSGSSTHARSRVHKRKHNPYKPYFDKADFLVDNWATASEIEKAPVYGMALLVATTVIVHPFVFFAGAATAVWAVGTFHGVQQG